MNARCPAPPQAAEALQQRLEAIVRGGGARIDPARRYVVRGRILAGVWVLYGLVAYPLLNDSSSARGLMAQAGARIGGDAELGLVAWKEQNLLMADRAATTFGFVMKTAWLAGV